jgi:hypothetical protein
MIEPLITRSLARVRGGVLAASIVLFAPLALLGTASPALAVEHHPTGEFAPFADCPLAQDITDCLVAETTSGSVTLGNETVPITKKMILQGGFRVVAEEDPELEFVGAENGETLSKVAQTVPGGLLGVVAPEFLPEALRNLIKKLVDEGLAGVTATTELAAPAKDIGLDTENLIDEEGTALSLPVKVKLSNTFLGSNCYIGSSSHPMVLNLTTGATSPPSPYEPIYGTKGKLTHNEAFTLLTLTGSKFVDNSFEAPEAQGCGGLLSLVIDLAVNAKLGLPAAPGKNTAILEGSELTAHAGSVTESE